MSARSSGGAGPQPNPPRQHHARRESGAGLGAVQTQYFQDLHRLCALAIVRVDVCQRHAAIGVDQVGCRDRQHPLALAIQRWQVIAGVGVEREFGLFQSTWPLLRRRPDERPAAERRADRALNGVLSDQLQDLRDKGVTQDQDQD